MAGIDRKRMELFADVWVEKYPQYTICSSSTAETIWLTTFHNQRVYWTSITPSEVEENPTPTKMAELLRFKKASLDQKMRDDDEQGVTNE